MRAGSTATRPDWSRSNCRSGRILRCSSSSSEQRARSSITGDATGEKSRAAKCWRPRVRPTKRLPDLREFPELDRAEAHDVPMVLKGNVPPGERGKFRPGRELAPLDQRLPFGAAEINVDYFL